jgi:hypothetical protein
MKRQIVPDVGGWEMVEGNIFGVSLRSHGAANAKTAAPQQPGHSVK